VSSSLLLIADPGAPAALADDLVESLQEVLGGTSSLQSDWDVSVEVQPYLLDEQAEIAMVIDWVDPSSHDQDVVIYLTDLPRRDGARPVVADISVRHRFGLISIPSMGGLYVGRRLRAVVESIVFEVARQRTERTNVATKLARTEEEGRVRYAAPRAFARLRLLSGMVYANRPWRLAAGMSRVMMATFASGAVSLAYPTIWQLSATMGPWRLSVTTVLASAAMVAWLVINHRLWERPHSRRERHRAALYNTSTVITLTIGVVVLHATSFVLLLLTACWTLPPQLLEQNLGHPVGAADYLRLAWLVAAVATLGGALGSGLEDDRAVREAAYGVRQRQRFDSPDHSSAV
jgi:hypothetical protein